MSERDDSIYLKNIVTSIEAIEVYTQTISELDFATNQMLQDAVTRRFEIIGEAAIHISLEFKSNHPR